MLNILIVDSRANQRHFWYQKIAEYLQELGKLSEHGTALLPSLSVNTASPDELATQENVDVVILTEDIVIQNQLIIKSIRSKVAGVGIIVALSGSGIKSLVQLEELISLGVDDYVCIDTTAIQFIGKVIVAARKNSKKIASKIIFVDSAKGGQGVTTVCAGLASALASIGKRVLLIDLDYDSQDLSRYLQARPYLNDNLACAIRSKKLLTKEMLEDCLTEICISEKIYCLSPASSDCYDLVNIEFRRFFLHFLELASSEFSVIIIDSGSLRGSDLFFWYKLSTEIVMVGSNDPASIYALITKLKNLFIAAGAHRQGVYILENHLHQNGFASLDFKKEITTYLNSVDSLQFTKGMKFSKTGFCWPASGQTIFSLSGKFNRRVLLSVVKTICDGLEPVTESPSYCSTIWEVMVRHLRRQISYSPTKPPALVLPTIGNFSEQEAIDISQAVKI